MGLKAWIPAFYRLQYQLQKRKWQDWSRRPRLEFAQLANETTPFPIALEISQPIRRSHLYENKLHNLRLGSQRISSLVLHPGQVLSFWRAVGPPISSNGFRKGRNLIAGELKEDYGGGLCQLSGLLYYLAIQAGLETLERYNHSVDIYTDETRFAPLGSDATVVYGYKDLRIRNVHNMPIRFSFQVEKERITAYLHTKATIENKRLEFVRKYDAENTIKVDTVSAEGELIATSNYAKLA